MKVRLRPAELDAWQWLGQPRAEWPEWVPKDAHLWDDCLAFKSAHVRRDTAHRTDWLLHADYVTVVSDDELKKRYERVG